MPTALGCRLGALDDFGRVRFATIGRSVNDYEGWEVGSSAMEDEDERK